MTRFCATIAVTLCLSAQADTSMPEPNWTLPEAREAAGQVDPAAAAEPLFALARDGRDDALLRALAELAVRADWPQPARERVLYEFALGLADLPPDAVGSDVMGWLLAYESRTLVPHDDFPLAGVPLYRVSAAATGSLNAWDRQTAAWESAGLLTRGPETWLVAFLAAAPARRPGFVDALELAPPAQLSRLAGPALERLPAEPALTAVAARIGVLLADPFIIEQTVEIGGGADLAPALRSAARALDEVGRAEVLRHAIAAAPPSNAALAIAELAPGLLHRPEVAELMFAELADRDLGPAAALALSTSMSPEVRARLEGLARHGKGLEASRAAIAVESRRSDRRGQQ